MAYSASLKDSSGIPISQVWVPGVGWAGLQGAPGSVDGSNNTTTGAVLVLGGAPATDPYLATVMAGGELRVAEQPTQLFLDTFDTSTLDVTNRWKTPTTGGGGVAASNTLTYTQIGSGTTANGYSYLESVPIFYLATPGWLYVQMAINVEYPVLANVYRFWGIGTSPTTPTSIAPLSNACGFEMTVTGKLFAVTYQSGNRVQIADLSSSGNNKQPLDGNPHNYVVYFRGDRIFWCIDGLDAVVAQTTNGAAGPDINNLPMKFTSIAHSIAPLSSGVLQVNAAIVCDTTRRHMQLSDGTFPWRKVTIDKLGGLRQAGCNATPIAAGASVPTIIKATPGTFYGIKVTGTPAAGTPTTYDNASLASGTIIDVVGTLAATGTLSPLPSGGVNCSNGIVVLGGASMPAMTVYWN